MTEEHSSRDPRAYEDSTAAIDRLAAELEAIERRESGPNVEFRLGGVTFAAREGSVHTFHLLLEVVRAGLRTPATSRSPRGAEWISLDTRSGDDYTTDRAKAWFELAWRLAGGVPEFPVEVPGHDDEDDDEDEDDDSPG